MKAGFSIAGSGSVILDVVFDDKADGMVQMCAGGSCGNVLTILSYLGWDSFPLIKIGKDLAAEKIIEDMRRFAVKTDYIERDKDVDTPVVLEQVFTESETGASRKRFISICPRCRTRLPIYRRSSPCDMVKAIEDIRGHDCFYFDCVTPVILDAVKIAKGRGAMVVFEPLNILNEDLFKEAVSECDILKFAHGNIQSIDEFIGKPGPALIIETLGRGGMRYRFRDNRKGDSNGRWRHLPAFRITDVIDETGSGDWCSAGIIYKIKKGGRSLDELSQDEIAEILHFGQSMGAVNCRFAGARGAMYKMSKDDFLKEVDKTIKNRVFFEEKTPEIPQKIMDLARKLCPKCKG